MRGVEGGGEVPGLSRSGRGVLRSHPPICLSGSFYFNLEDLGVFLRAGAAYESEIQVFKR